MAVALGRRHDPAALRPQPARSGNDWWPTPGCLTTAFIRYVLPFLPEGIIWECAAGDGRMARAMQAAGRSVIATDIAPAHPDVAPLDFLRSAPPQAGLLAVTNGPFSNQTAFMARGLQLMDRGCIAGLVLLARLDHLQAEERVDVLNRVTLAVYCNWRVRWIPGSRGNPRWTNVWLAWLLNHPRQPPRWLKPPQRDRQLILTMEPTSAPAPTRALPAPIAAQPQLL
jgi:hypothetical protein